MSEFPTTPRPIDHCVLPVADLDTARRRLGALGFTVAPTGEHPFGTENACVYFADGTFLEPLAIGDPKLAETAKRSGNVFVARDHAYRFRRGENGFSALVMGTSDAAADEAHFRRNGMSGGPILEFSRPFVDAAGKSDTVSFKLAFAADLRAPDAFFFTCERVNAPEVDRSALQRHENGAARISEIVLSEPNPEHFEVLLQQVTSQREVKMHAGGFALEAANARISVLDAAAMKERFGHDLAAERGLLLQAIAFQVGDLGFLEKLFSRNGIASERRGARIVVAPQPGQGAIFAFEVLS